MTTVQSTAVQPKAVELTATEKKLIQQIQAQAPAKQSLVKYVSKSIFGFNY